jgi:hypothetical protein
MVIIIIIITINNFIFEYSIFAILFNTINTIIEKIKKAVKYIKIYNANSSYPKITGSPFKIFSKIYTWVVNSKLIIKITGKIDNNAGIK